MIQSVCSDYWGNTTAAVRQPKSVHKEKSNKMQQCIKILLFHIYMKISMFWATCRPSSGA